MRHAFSPVCEALGARRLLAAHAAHVVHPVHAAHVVHPVHAAHAVPVVLSGTLNVNSSSASSGADMQGNTVTSIPIAGMVAPLGKVHGVWTKTFDPYGSYVGPDTLTLRGAHGAIGVKFDTSQPLSVIHSPGMPLSQVFSQRVPGGSGAYARASESGTITLTSNAARTTVATMILSTGQA